MQNDKWFSSFKKGFVTCFVICGAIAGVAGYLIDRLLDLKEAEIDRASSQRQLHFPLSDNYTSLFSMCFSLSPPPIYGAYRSVTGSEATGGGSLWTPRRAGGFLRASSGLR